jgi:hypothetical protein
MVTRRDWLAGAAGFAVLRGARAAGTLEKGVYRVRGEARINRVRAKPKMEVRARAKPKMEVRAGDVITTGPDGELIFVIARDAMLVRAGALVETGLRIVTGAVLSVFEPGKAKRIRTPTATIGIRGTGIYVELRSDRTYVCTCYGEAEIAATADPAASEVVRTRHHDQPRYVMAQGAPQMIMAAPVVNHSDAELILLEGLVGREPPFVGAGYAPTRY